MRLESFRRASVITVGARLRRPRRVIRWTVDTRTKSAACRPPRKRAAPFVVAARGWKPIRVIAGHLCVVRAAKNRSSHSYTASKTIIVTYEVSAAARLTRSIASWRLRATMMPPAGSAIRCRAVVAAARLLRAPLRAKRRFVGNQNRVRFRSCSALGNRSAAIHSGLPLSERSLLGRPCVEVQSRSRRHQRLGGCDVPIGGRRSCHARNGSGAIRPGQRCCAPPCGITV